MEEMKNITKHMYQDGNDLVVVYTNIFNNNLSLEKIIKDEIMYEKNITLVDIAKEIEPVETKTPEQPVIIEFGFIPSEKWKTYRSLGGMTKKSEQGKAINYVTSEDIAKKIEETLQIKRKG